MQAVMAAPSPTVALETILEESGNSKLAAYGAILNGLLPVTMPARSAPSTIKGKRRDRMISTPTPPHPPPHSSPSPWCLCAPH
jgi:hypothetical protein